MTPQLHTPLPARAPAGRTIVVGLGRTGMSCARHLRSRHVAFAVTDSRAAPPEAAALRQLAPEADVVLGNFDTALLDGAAEIVVSPGISLREPFVREAARRGLPVVGDVELFAREVRAPVAAITGTNGKSTVTTLVAAMAERAGRKALAGGNLGRPALDLLNDPVPDLYVLELSSFQLDTTSSLHTAAATVLNVTPDHMDRYDTLEAYADSKARIFANCDAAVINLDDPLVRKMLQPANLPPPQPSPASGGGSEGGPRVVGFSVLEDSAAGYFAIQIGDDIALMNRDTRIARMSELRITGLHNAANALAAIAMADALGLERAACVTALREFAGLPHRSQWVAEIGGVRYVDDSKGTNVGATLAAVAGMPGTLIVIAGGQGKGQDFTALAPAFRGKVRHAVLLGQDARQIATALEGVCTIEFAQDMPQAVQRCAQVARTGETVLLSPACASLDMFRDYAHRGAVFAAAVKELRS